MANQRLPAAEPLAVTAGEVLTFNVPAGDGCNLHCRFCLMIQRREMTSGPGPKIGEWHDRLRGKGGACHKTAEGNAASIGFIIAHRLLAASVLISRSLASYREQQPTIGAVPSCVSTSRHARCSQ
jgi:hypothetical protein